MLFLYAMKAYAGSEIGVFSFGSPINGSALLIILLHQVIESRTVVSQSQLFNANLSSIMQCNLKSKSFEKLLHSMPHCVLTKHYNTIYTNSQRFGIVKNLCF